MNLGLIVGSGSYFTNTILGSRVVVTQVLSHLLATVLCSYSMAGVTKALHSESGYQFLFRGLAKGCVASGEQ